MKQKTSISFLSLDDAVNRRRVNGEGSGNGTAQLSASDAFLTSSC